MNHLRTLPSIVVTREKQRWNNDSEGENSRTKKNKKTKKIIQQRKK
jgi:hypothetical protein